MLKAEIDLTAVPGFEPSQPVRLDTPIPKNGGGQRRQPAGGRPGARMGEQKPGGERAPRKPGNRGHGKPADRSAHAHAGPKQHRPGAGRPQERRDSRA
jgi:ATP-dependent RNA helicase RhlE